MDSAFFRGWIDRSAAAIEEQREHLTELDAAIGDSDHGTNLARGFTAVLAALDEQGELTPGPMLMLVGRTLISKVGGASGPLYGTAFRRFGQALGDAPTIDLATLAKGFEAALGGIQALGGAQEGDKTMVDALTPAVAMLTKSAEDEAALDDALIAVADAAAEGAEATIPLQARKGRASYLGERSIGHEDPGAASTALLFAALRDTAEAAE